MNEKHFISVSMKKLNYEIGKNGKTNGLLKVFDNMNREQYNTFMSHLKNMPEWKIFISELEYNDMI